MPSNTDIERAFYGAQAGLTDAQIATKTTGELRVIFLNTPLVKVPTSKPAVASVAAPGALYVQSEAQAAVTAINAIRAALISAGLIQ